MKLAVEDLLLLRDVASRAAREAGELIQRRVGSALVVEHKEAGGSLASQVVTEVDRAVESHLLGVLEETRLRYDIGLLTEERVDDGSRFRKDYFWCIDPLDGTLPFVEGSEGYSVSLALVNREGESLVGVVYDPRHQVLYEAVRGLGCRIDGERFLFEGRPKAPAGLLVFGDRSARSQHDFDVVLAALDELSRCRSNVRAEVLLGGGAAMNACWALRSASGCYFKLPKKQQGGGSVWDFAATECLFRESGGVVTSIFGKALLFNPQDSCFMNRGGVLYATDRQISECIRKAYTNRQV